MSKLSVRETPAGQKPLNQRFGYDVDAVRDYWGALDKKGKLGAERRFLEMDLVFPFFYGAALAISVLLGSSALDRPFNPAWLLVPVFAAVLADWAENLAQLQQIKRYLSGRDGLQAGWIQVASFATMLKLAFGIGAFVLVVSLVVIMLVRALRSA